MAKCTPPGEPQVAPGADGCGGWEPKTRRERAEDGFFDAEAGLAAEEAFGAETDSEGEYEGET